MTQSTPAVSSAAERWTVRALLAWSAPWLAERGCDAPRLDAELMLAKALQVRRLDLFLDPERPLLAEELAAYKALIRRRARREPLAYILGERAFWRQVFAVRPGVLIPRPDSERLVEAVLERWPDRQAAGRVLELGVGSGALLLSLLGELPNARGVGVDLSPAAAACTAHNAARLGLTGRLGVWVGDLSEALAVTARFEVVICNPPYISNDEYAGLMPEVRDWEPAGALLAGEDGLAMHRRWIPVAVDHLAPQGWLVAEIGWRQGAAVAALFDAAGLGEVAVLSDYGQHERVVVGRRGVG